MYTHKSICIIVSIPKYMYSNNFYDCIITRIFVSISPV